MRGNVEGVDTPSGYSPYPPPDQTSRPTRSHNVYTSARIPAGGDVAKSNSMSRAKPLNLTRFRRGALGAV
jgi:hypothetical protein